MQNNITATDTAIIKSLLKKGKEHFSGEDINEICFKGKGSPIEVYRVINRLITKNWAARIQRGKYILLNVSDGKQHNPFIIAMHLVQPAAISYWSAINYYGLTDQMPKTVFVQTTKRKRAAKNLQTEYQFITLNKEKFFGIKKQFVGHLNFTITDLEKTIVDCFDYPQYSGGIAECARALKSAKNIDAGKLISYAVRMNNSALIKRLGFTAEKIKMDLILQGLNKAKINLSEKYSLLDPSLADHGKYSSKWKLRINTDINKLNNH